MRRPISLRAAYLILGTSLSAMSLLLIVVLVGAADRLVALSAELSESIVRLRAVDEVAVELLRATREHQLFIETGDRRWDEGARRAEAQITEALEIAGQVIETPEQQVLYDQLTAAVEAVRREVLRGTAGRTFTKAEIDHALDVAEQLIVDTQRDAENARADADRWSRIAVIVSLLGIVVVLGSLFGAVYTLQRLFYRPVEELRSALERRTLESAAHVPERGPSEVRVIAAGINQLVDRLTAQRAQQLEFLSGVAHDLRNPMTTLRASIQLVARKAEDEQARTRADRVIRQVDRLDRLVGDLLEVTRVEGGRFELHREPRDLREVVEEACAFAADASENHAVRCALPATPVVVDYDVARITQVLGNLLSNAIKYSPGGGEVEVRLSVRGPHAVVEVEDHGIGILPEDRDSIFTPFRRSSRAREADIPGVGLGLSVARRLVRAHGGEIEVESEPGRGSTFRVRLPVA